MLNYDNAAQLYEGRKDKHVGRKVHNGIYMKHDPEHDCFVVSELWSKYESAPDPDRPGQAKYQKAPKERWHMRPFAEVYRDRIVITREINNSRMHALFRVESFASRTIRQLGRTWIYKNDSGGHQRADGEVPMMIKDDTLSSLVPAKVRVVDPQKRKEMNRMIQSIRNLLKVRTKLGAFDKITPNEIGDYMRQTDTRTKWQVFNSPAKFLELMQAVDPGDIKSFYPLLWLADKNWYYTNDNANFGRVDWVARYNNLVNRMREKMRRELGAVEYVEADERRTA